MPRYLISLGNSDKGPIGSNVFVHGADAEDALANFKKAMNRDPIADYEYITAHDDEDAIEYATVFLNHEHITISDVFEDEECDRNECEQCNALPTVADDTPATDAPTVASSPASSKAQA